MTDFSNLEALNVAGKTAKMYIEELGDDAYLELRVADESNSPWYNAILEHAAVKAAKQVGSRRRKPVAASAVDTDELAANRVRDAELFPRYIIVSWSDVTNAAGEIVPHSVEAAKALVAQLCKSCPRIFDEIRAFAQTVGNFMEQAPADIDPTGLVEN